jgi:hypothetical protein
MCRWIAAALAALALACLGHASALADGGGANIIPAAVARTILIGPLVDETDGFTVETGLTISQADVQIAANGGTFAQKNDATSCTHRIQGIYGCPLNTTDTNLNGILTVIVHETGARPWRGDWMVIAALPYDSLVPASDFLRVDTRSIGDVTVSTTTAQVGCNVVQVSTDATAADNLELAYDGAGYAGGTILQAVNAAAISGDTVAADSLEAALDGTGGVTITAGLTGAITGSLSGSVGSVTAGVNVTQIEGVDATNQIGASVPSAATIAAAVFATPIDTGLTFFQEQYYLAGLFLGRASGMQGSSNTFRAFDNAADAIVFTTDQWGNRSNVVVTPP